MFSIAEMRDVDRNIELLERRVAVIPVDTWSWEWMTSADSNPPIVWDYYFFQNKYEKAEMDMDEVLFN